jgi:uncharacterized protein YjdB
MKKNHKLIMLIITVSLLSAFSCERNDLFEESLKARVNIPLMNITMNKTSTAIETGSTEQLYIIYEPSDATNKKVIWSSNNEAIATVAGGKVAALAQGTAIITAVSEEGAYITQCDVSVVAGAVSVLGITLNASSQNIVVGETFPLSVFFSPSNATNQNVTWSSSNPAAAYVYPTGAVEGMGAGNAVITATSQDGGKTATCDITVSNVAVMSVEISPSPVSLSLSGSPYPTEIQLSAIILPSNATNQTVIWESQDTGIATVDSNGMVTAVTAGTPVNIQVTTVDGGKMATCTITIN